MREKLIELLKKTPIAEINGHIAEAEACFVSHVFASMADHLIANGVRLETKQATSEENKRWIPVTERVPREFVSVLVCIPSEHPMPMVKEAYMANNWWTTKFGVYSPKEVTHWMPLPEPPKEVE